MLENEGKERYFEIVELATQRGLKGRAESLYLYKAC